VEVRIRSIATGGEGVGDLPDGRVCFVPRSAPGDLLEVALVQDRARWARGRIVRVVEPGSGRIEAPCPYYDQCGGCALQHLAYPRQTQAKGEIARETLGRIGGVSLETVPVHPSPRTTEYRNRASFSLRRLRGGRVVAGFHELLAPARVMDLDGPCLLLEPPLPGIWVGLRNAWGSGARALPEGKELRLTLRRAGEGAILLIQGGGGRPGDAGHLLEAVPGLDAVWWEPRGGERRLLAASEAADHSVTLDGVPEALAFVQVNEEAGALLTERLLAIVGHPAGRSIIDAYCGVGELGRELARRGAVVKGIELDPVAAAAGRREEEVPDQEWTGTFKILEGRVEDVLPDLPAPDLLIVNPPRSGLHRAVVDRILAATPPRLIYVSCDPATLARDSSLLSSRMSLAGAEVVDMFPQTAQMETIAVFVRRDPQEGKTNVHE
jgi:23S rRNA (uracil1939-C5)-methyltransferase